jgi:hypothetical protein
VAFLDVRRRILLLWLWTGTRQEPDAMCSADTASVCADEDARLGPDALNSGTHPRDPSEWQGMLVDLDSMAPCDTTERCGLAMVCHSGKCGPCVVDEHCAMGEVCVLDHCVLQDNAHCRSYRDCGDGELCVLSGYSSDPRGNAEMLARCQHATMGGA